MQLRKAGLGVRRKQQTKPQFHMQAHSSKQQLYKISTFSVDKKIGCSHDAMPASRRRSMSPPTQLRKADLGTQEFRQSRLILRSSNPIENFRAFSCISWLKNLK
jgi:hypothetical protein